MINIGFVIIATEEEPWTSINRVGQESTWLKDLRECDRYLAAYSLGNLGESRINPKNHRKIEFLSGSSRSHNLSEPKFFNKYHATFEGVRGYGSLVGTTLSAMNYLVNESDCDFIVRTNVSSYWGIEKLREFLADKPQSNYYAGCAEKLYGGLRGRIQETKYASGAGIIMSADVAKRLVENRRKFSKRFIDDLAIGRVASSLGLELNYLNRIDLDSLEKLNQLSSEDLSGNYHFRCKSYIYPGVAEPRGDIEIMRELHMRRSSKSGATEF
jgi:hypothetical protein